MVQYVLLAGRLRNKAMKEKSPLARLRKERGLSRSELASLAFPDDSKIRTQLSNAIARCEAGFPSQGWELGTLWVKLKEQGIDIEGKQSIWIEANQ